MRVLLEPRWWIVLFVSALSTWALARIARRLGWGDAAEGPEAARKLQAAPVPAVGGPALLIAIAVARPGTPGPDPVGWVVLVLVFLAGALDDLRPLRPRTKVLLQVLALAPAAWAASGSEAAAVAGWPGGPEVILLGLLALNVTNTFDNADGAVASVALVGFAFAQPLLAAAVLGFLFLNLDAGAPWRRRARTPTAYLGDSGSFVVGFLILVAGRPAGQAWPALWIPLLDLLRLVVVRWRAKSRPWVGDRRHLAHRLQARGLGPIAVAAILAGMTLPGCLGVHFAGRHPLFPALGLTLGAASFVLAVLRTPHSQ